MAKPNYAFAKRQRDLAKKQKKEEKRQRKAGAQSSQAHEEPPQRPADEKIQFLSLRPVLEYGYPCFRLL